MIIITIILIIMIITIITLRMSLIMIFTCSSSIPFSKATWIKN